MGIRNLSVTFKEFGKDGLCHSFSAHFQLLCSNSLKNGFAGSIIMSQNGKGDKLLLEDLENALLSIALA